MSIFYNKHQFPYKTANYENVVCNICNSKENSTVAETDRNNLLVRTVICKNCGLVFISPRMTPSWYDQYYQHEYRRQGAYYKGLFVEKEVQIFYNPQALFHKAVVHGQKIIDEIRPFINKGLTIEVGSSSGGILSAFKQNFESKVIGIEPSEEEAKCAVDNGIYTFNTMFENLSEDIPPVDVMLCVRTLNHLLDPKLFLEWAHTKLKPGGKIVLEVMNFRAVAKRLGSVEKAVQIDHVYMFTPETLRTLVCLFGFSIVYINTDRDPSKEHIILVAEKIISKKEISEINTSTYKNEIKALRSFPSSNIIYLKRYGLKRMYKRTRARLRALLINK